MDLAELIANPKWFQPRGYKTYSIHTVEEILTILNESKTRKDLGKFLPPQNLAGRIVSVDGNRVLTYTKGLTCELCKRARVTFFAVQVNGGRPHLNAWGEDEHGELVMFTSDHIIPKFRGGGGGLENRQPACGPCNWGKRDRLPGEEFSPKMLEEMANKKEKEARRKANLQQYRFHPTDRPKTKSKKLAVLRHVADFERQLGELIDPTVHTGVVPSTVIRSLIRKITSHDITKLLEHPEVKWGLTAEQMVEIIKLTKRATQTAPEIFKLVVGEQPLLRQDPATLVIHE